MPFTRANAVHPATVQHPCTLILSFTHSQLFIFLLPALCGLQACPAVTHWDPFTHRSPLTVSSSAWMDKSYALTQWVIMCIAPLTCPPISLQLFQAWYALRVYRTSQSTLSFSILIWDSNVDQGSNLCIRMWTCMIWLCACFRLFIKSLSV